MKTKSFVLKPFCYGLAVEKYQNGLFLSFVDPCLSEEEKSSLSFSQEWDLPTQERRKKKNAPTQKLSKNSWRRSQKIIKNDKEEKRIYKVLLREAKSSNLNLTPHTTVFHQFPYYSHLWTMSRVPGNRTGIEIRSFKDQLIVNLMSFSI
jgi:hypothetical protein